MMLADLGADVIKVNTMYDGYWMSNHIGMACNRGKRSISINLKDPNGMDILRRLVETADVVQHNMRYDAAVRLGVDYESLKKIKPDLIYCHTRGFEKSERELLPGNDQTGAALAGPDWLDGGLDHDGTPLWPVISLGDTGNGFLSAIAMRAGAVPPRPHRRGPVRRHVDHLRAAPQRRRSGGSRRTASTRATVPKSTRCSSAGTRCTASTSARTRRGCASPRSRSRTGSRCARRSGATTSRPTRASRPPTPARPTTTISTRRSRRCSRGRPRASGSAILDAAGVPVEVSTPDFVLDLFNDPEILKRGWIAEYQHPTVGKMNQFGLMFDMSETPGVIQGPPLTPGMNTREILREIDFDADQIAKLEEEKVVLDTSEQIG